MFPWNDSIMVIVSKHQLPHSLEYRLDALQWRHMGFMYTKLSEIPLFVQQFFKIASIKHTSIHHWLFVRGTHHWPDDSPREGTVMWKSRICQLIYWHACRRIWFSDNISYPQKSVSHTSTERMESAEIWTHIVLGWVQGCRLQCPSDQVLGNLGIDRTLWRQGGPVGLLLPGYTH